MNPFLIIVTLWVYYGSHNFDILNVHFIILYFITYIMHIFKTSGYYLLYLAGDNLWTADKWWKDMFV